MKNKKSFIKIVRMYILVLTFCIFSTAVACGVVIAANNTNLISSGEHAETVGIHNEEKLDTPSSDVSRVINYKVPDILDKLSIAMPFPVGSLCWFIQESAELADIFLG